MAFSTKLAAFRARHASKLAHARGMMGKVKPIAIAVGTGGGAQYAGEFAANHIEFLRTHWWGEGALLAAGGYVMEKRNARIAAALEGAAGYSLAQRRKMSQGKFQVPNFTGSSSAGSATSGIDDDTGSLQTPGEI